LYDQPHYGPCFTTRFTASRCLLRGVCCHSNSSELIPCQQPPIITVRRVNTADNDEALLLAFSFLWTCFLSFPPVCPCFYLHFITPQLYFIFVISFIPVGARVFAARPWGPPSLLYNGYRGLSGRGVAMTTPI